jgi:hypothetical protein
MSHTVLLKDQGVPAHEEAPLDSHPHAGFHVGYRPVLTHHNHLLITNNRLQTVIDILSTHVVQAAWIAIVSYYIYLEVARVPIYLRCAPNPNQVVDFLVLSEPLEHHVVESLAGLASPGAPPKPLSTSFV